MERKIGYAVVGLGIGKAHVDAAAACEKANLVAVCDLVQEKMDKIVEKYPGTKTYTDFDELMKDDEVGVVSICLPSSMHAEYAARAMRAGKHVLVEKPLDITPEAAMLIEEVRRETGMKAGVVHQNRNNVDMLPIKKAIEMGHLGKVFMGTFAVKWYRKQSYFEGAQSWHGTWEVDGGGSLMNQAVHTVDLMQWFMGDVASVTSHMDIYNHNIETEDATVSIIRFKSGAVATFVSTTCAYPGLATEICVYGTGGSVEADQDELKTWKVKEFSDEFAEELGLDATDEEEEEEEMLARYGKGNPAYQEENPGTLVGHRSVVEDMVDAVLNDRDPQILPLEAIKAVRIVTAVYESAKTGKTVYFD
ncbi:MAG: Gfo/Idh/MocA family oxidoreductase [Clostridia bacterium]|nr:Gfo/Idh/MocA family oxidoreductase [Clostridia bacterium]